MEISLSKFSRLAMVALIAGSMQAKAESIAPMKKLDAIAACNTLMQEIKSQQGLDKVSNVSELTTVCDQGLEAVYDQMRALGSEYFFGGFGVYVSVEGNIPFNARFAYGARGAFGGSAFITDNVGMRFTPMINFVPVALQMTWKGSPSPVELQYGLIVFVGDKKTKSIKQFNGIYAGGGFEIPKVGSSALQNRSSVTVNFVHNVQTRALAIVVMKSLNAGSDMVAINGQLMYVNNITRTGAGAKASDIYSGGLNALSQKYSDGMQAMSNYADSLLGKSKN